MPQFPAPLAHIIAEYAAQWTIKKWIAEQLPLSEPDEPDHPGPIVVHEYLDKWGRESIEWIWMNPMAEDYVRGRRVYKNNVSQLAQNPADWALDLFEQFVDENDEVNHVAELCSNTNPRAIAKLKKFDSDIIEWDILSENPAAIDLLSANRNKIDYRYIQHNPAALDIIAENLHEFPIDVEILANPAIFELTIPDGLQAKIMGIKNE